MHQVFEKLVSVRHFLGTTHPWSLSGAKYINYLRVKGKFWFFFRKAIRLVESDKQQVWDGDKVLPTSVYAFTITLHGRACVIVKLCCIAAETVCVISVRYVC